MSDNLENEKAINLNDMEIKNLDSIIPHLAIENVFNSNLIDDIGYVDYTENSKGLTCLKPLEGLPDYIDDLYIFKYIHISEIDEKTINNKKIYLNKGKDGSASTIVKKFTSVTKEVFDIFCEQKIVFLVNLQNEKEKENSTIYQTLKAIERRTEEKALNGYKNYYECDNPVAVIKYKVNTSRLPLKKVLDNLNILEKRLNVLGGGLMSIDYTRDLSGVLEKKRMVEHFLKLGFIEQSNSEEENKKYYIIDEFTRFKMWEEKTIKDEDEDEDKFKIKIIDSDATCGRNTFKYIKNDGTVCYVVKYYNKIAANFEAGDVQKKIGTHLAEYAFTHSCDHLEKTFRHPDVKKRGLTRLEISIHGFNPKINYSRMLEEEFNLVKNARIFHIQPGAEQWLRLAKHITQCALFANKATKEITLFWYGSSLTKRAAGVTKKLKKKDVDANPKEWEHATKWMMLNFGFSGVPIYNISLDVKEKQKQEEEQQEEEQQQEEQQQEEKQQEEEQQQEEKQEEEQQEEKQEEEQQEEQQEEQKQEEKQEEQKQEEQPKRKRGRPTRREEEERRSKLTEEEREQEDELKEMRRQQREEKKRIKAEELAVEVERLKNLPHEEKQKEEEKKQQEEERKKQEKERKKQEKKDEKNQKKDEEGLKLYITDFSYCLKEGPTFLTPFNKPTKMYISTNEKEVKKLPCEEDEIFNYPSTILPDTKNIKWRFRVEPDHKRIGQKKLPKYPFQRFENPDKKISTNSTRERNTIIYLDKENEKSKEWIKDKNTELKKTREERIRFKKDLENKIKNNLKDTKTIALYEERKNTIDEVFHCFSNPGEIQNILNENEYIHIFAFKVYPNCTRIAYKVQNDIKVCFANPLIVHMLNGLRDTCFIMLPKEETKYKPECPVYFMSYASLKAKGQDGNDLKIVDEIDGEEIKNFNEMLDKYYGDWEELRRLENLKTPKMEEVFEEKVKPTTTVNLESGEYTAYKYLKRTFRGKEQIIVYIKREDEKEEPIYGYWLNEELKKIDLDKTATPIYIKLGCEQFNPLRHKDRHTTIVSIQTD